MGRIRCKIALLLVPDFAYRALMKLLGRILQRNTLMLVSSNYAALVLVVWVCCITHFLLEVSVPHEIDLIRVVWICNYIIQTGSGD